MRVLLLSQYFFPEVGATQTRMYEFASALAALGHEVDVLAEFPNHPSGVIPPAYQKRLFEIDSSHAFRILRVWVYATPRKTFLRRLLFYGSFFAMAILGSLRLKARYDAVVATSPPLPVAAAGLVISRLKRAAFLMDVRDLWPLAARALGELSNPRLYRWAEWLELRLYRSAARITATTHSFCKYIAGRVPDARDRVAHVPNGTLDEIFDPGRGDSGIRARLGLEGKLVVMYAGLHGIAQGLMTVLDAAERLKEKDSIEFVFVGEGPEKSRLVREAEARGLVHTRFLAQVPLEESALYLNASDLQLVPLAPDPVFDLFIPSKLFDAMACEKPVILMVGGEAREILDRSGAGVFVKPGDADALAHEILRLAGRPEERKVMGRRGRGYVQEHFLRSIQARRFARIVVEAADAHRLRTVPRRSILRRWMNLARKSLNRSPSFLAARAVKELRRQAWRPFSRLRPRLLTEASLLRKTGLATISELWAGLAAAPFFAGTSMRDTWGPRFCEAFPTAKAAVLDNADAAVRHEFDLLGSGPVSMGKRIRWDEDFKTGRRWPLSYFADIDSDELDRPSDIKVPWELSRCQHFTSLGQAYWLTGDERYAREIASEIDDWIGSNPYAHGVNWACAMDVALRAISWIWAFHFCSPSGAFSQADFQGRFLRSMFLHGELIASNLERSEVNGNHYLVDGAGLIFLGGFFSGMAEGRRWLKIGARIIFEEMGSQVSDDGVDFEQSVSYHRLVLETFLTCAILLRAHGIEPPAAFLQRLEKMFEFTSAYLKPDGSAPLIGDADDGRLQKLGPQPINDHRYLLSTGAVLFGRADFKAGAKRLWEETFWLLGPDALTRYDNIPPAHDPPRSIAFPKGGFFVLRNEAVHAVIDCAEVGMNGRGGHGHNDMLSFELFMNGFNLITDCGAYVYTASREWRDRFRSTAFHNTVQIDGAELNRFLSPVELWRLRYDAAPTGPAWVTDDRTVRFSGGHTGYSRISPGLVHLRKVEMPLAGRYVTFRDAINGVGTHDVVWSFHLDPAVLAEVRGNDVHFAVGDREAWLLPVIQLEGSKTRIEKAWVSPSYGVKVESTVVRIEYRARLPIEYEYLFACDWIPEVDRMVGP